MSRSEFEEILNVLPNTRTTGPLKLEGGSFTDEVLIEEVNGLWVVHLTLSNGLHEPADRDLTFNSPEEAVSFLRMYVEGLGANIA